MIFIAAGLLIFATAMIVIALRGRVVSRGSFCRKCRFDLQGLASDAPACPECGEDLSREHATRPTLRQKRRVVLVLGLMLLLAGLPLMSISVTNKTARVLAALPDRVVLTLHTLGMDAAYTEIATNRLTQTNPLNDDTWAKLIETALAHQADENIVWDPRDGEVLFQAFTRDRLTPEQIEQYFETGLEVYAEFPDEIRHGADEMGVTLTVQPTGRISCLSGSFVMLTDGTDTVWNRLQISAGGVVDPAYERPISNSAGFAGLHIPGVSGGGRGSIVGRIALDELDWDSIKADEAYTFYIKYKVGVVRMTDQHIHQQAEGIIKQPVRVLPSDAQLVELDTHPDTIGAFADHPAFRIAPLHIDPEQTRRKTKYGTHLGACNTITENLPIAVAGDAVLIFQGQEYRMGQVSREQLSGHGISSMQWVTDDPVPEDLIEDMLEAGSVTIEIRPNPSVAEKIPGIKQILGLPLRFEDVIVTSEPKPRSQSSMPHPDQRTGRVVTDPADD